MSNQRKLPVSAFALSAVGLLTGACVTTRSSEATKELHQLAQIRSTPSAFNRHEITVTGYVFRKGARPGERVFLFLEEPASTEAKSCSANLDDTYAFNEREVKSGVAILNRRFDTDFSSGVRVRLTGKFHNSALAVNFGSPLWDVFQGYFSDVRIEVKNEICRFL